MVVYYSKWQPQCQKNWIEVSLGQSLNFGCHRLWLGFKLPHKCIIVPISSLEITVSLPFFHHSIVVLNLVHYWHLKFHFDSTTLGSSLHTLLVTSSLSSWDAILVVICYSSWLINLSKTIGWTCEVPSIFWVKECW